MGSYDCIAAGIHRYPYIARCYIPIFAFALKLRKGIKNQTSTETYHVGRIP